MWAIPGRIQLTVGELHQDVASPENRSGGPGCMLTQFEEDASTVSTVPVFIQDVASLGGMYLVEESN